MKLFYLLIIFSIPFIACDNGYKFCVSESDAVDQKCQSIQKGNSKVSCVGVKDSADCAMKLIDKKAHFAALSAEDALYVSKYINDKVSVIGELRHKDLKNETFAFETVVVVKKDHSGGLGGLRSTNYCHPGLGDGQFWTDRVLKEFESVVVPRNCDTNMSNPQLEIASLAEFFKTACRPGMWSLDYMLDKKLKRKYPSLCALCDSPGRCSYNEDVQGSHREALTCLTDGGGDVTYVALDFVKEHFGLKPNFPPKANPDMFRFLCPDGTYRSLRDPCAWMKQTWPVVIALKENAQVLNSSIPNEFLCRQPECRGKWQEAFTLLLEKNLLTFSPISTLGDNLLNYVTAGRKIPREWEGDPCRNRTVRLCTINSDEYTKCSWLKQAVISAGIEPRLQCVQSYNFWSCFDIIKKQQADVIGIDSDYTFIASNSFNLSTIMYQDNNNEEFFLILPIVRDDFNFKSFADFKNKRISFPEYNGLAWNAFLSNLKKQSLLPKKCPYLSAFSDFVKSACVPGVHDVNHKNYNISVPENVCALCANVNNNSKESCAANSSNKYFGDFGALTALLENVSDVTIIDYKHLFSSENEIRFKQLNTSSYRVLCKDGSRKPLLHYLEIGTDCALSYGLGAEILSRSAIKKPERRDITELFLKMNDRFGERLLSSDNPIKMYRSFNGIPGLIFREHTIDLVPIHDEGSHFISSLAELKTISSEKCHEWKSSATNNFYVSHTIIFISVLIHRFFL